MKPRASTPVTIRSHATAATTAASDLAASHAVAVATSAPSAEPSAAPAAETIPPELHFTPQALRLWMTYWRQRGSADRDATRLARNEVVVFLQPWLRELSDRLIGRMPQHVQREDLVSEMNKRLIGLVEKYDPTHRISFELYAGKALTGACHDFLRKAGWVKRTDRKFRKEAQAAREQFLSESGRDPSNPEWAEQMGLSTALFEAKKPRLTGREMTSLSAATANGHDDHAMLIDHRTVDPVQAAERREVIELLCRGLQEKEREVMLAYYLLGLTMHQIGERMNLSEARVSQLHARVLKTLRVKFANRRDDLL
ncbi:MAG: sigma-70 family RNA polymerase sigma factor [Planctomycetota bacterium]